MMKIGAISLLLMLLLTGCKADTELERGMALRSALLQADVCRFEANVYADYGDSGSRFGMACEFDNLGNMTFTVTDPESISGISGQIEGSDGNLTFDGLILSFSPVTDDQISPVCAPWILMKTLRSGYLTAACMEEGYLRLTIDDSYEEDALTLDFWLDEKNSPVHAEAVCNGRRILSLEISNFVIM